MAPGGVRAVRDPGHTTSLSNVHALHSAANRRARRAAGARWWSQHRGTPGKDVLALADVKRFAGADENIESLTTRPGESVRPGRPGL